MRSIRNALLVGVLLLVGSLPALGQQRPLIRFANEHWLAFVLFDRLELEPASAGQPLAWDMDGWVGKVYDRLWVRSEGDLRTDRREGEMEFQVLYSRLIAPYWDAQIGTRMELALAEGEVRRRFHLAVGLEGLAPYWFEMEPQVFISQDGDISASLLASHDVFITQRLILQGQLEALAALQEVPEWGVGRGLNMVDTSFRLRYEIRREFAPYVGFRWQRLFGGTADIAQNEGEAISQTGLVFGIRVWY